MEVILIVNAIRSDVENQLAYEVRITQGADQINSEQDLIEELRNTIPGKRGIISAKRVSSVIWNITTSKQ